MQTSSLYSKSMQQADSNCETHPVAFSTDLTGTCFNLSHPAVTRGTPSQALSQSTVCGPGPAQLDRQPGRSKRPRQECSDREDRTSKRPCALQLTLDETYENLDDCDGEEEVQSNYKAMKIDAASIQPLLMHSQIQQVHTATKHQVPNATSTLNFPVLRRASAGCKPEVSVSLGFSACVNIGSCLRDCLPRSH